MRKNNDPGLGIAYEKNVRRLLNQDGSFNIKRKGGASWYKDTYKFLIDISGVYFLLLAFIAYLGINLLFATAYYFLGENTISGLEPGQNLFLQCFYFSAQTFTTVGYGSLLPKGNMANTLAITEAFIGFLSFSLATGILYGRFSKPNSKINFSNNIILTNYNDGKAVMFKMVNARKNVLLKAHADVILICDKQNPATPFEK
jgi:inward rectifier potassium channel